jgi:hypothetical protein
MDLVKLCPACNEENPVSEVICRVCMTNLASVSPVPAGRQTLYSTAVLTLQLPNGRALPAASGDVLGRSGGAALFFEAFQTVSRRHAKVDFRGGAWQIEDLQSTNGTWINGKRLNPGQPCLLKTGDVVALSLACEMRVIG